MIRTQHVGRFALESGVVLGDVRQAYLQLGRLNARRDNAVFVFHSLTGSPDVEQWWAGIVGPGCAIDTDRYAVFCPNLLGSCYGTTGLPEGITATPRDMARLAAELLREHAIAKVALATGGSLGGMVALEWAAVTTSLTEKVVVFAAPEAHTAQAIGFNHVQRQALELGSIELARMAALLTYRTAAEFEQRFGRERSARGEFQVQSYLTYQGAKLAQRFSVRAYRALLDAMDAHEVRGLAAYRGRLVGVGITGDLLYTPDDVRRWTTRHGAEYREIASVHGHDAFLLEREQVNGILAEVLRAPALEAAS